MTKTPVPFRKPPHETGETRVVDALTVFWMISVVHCLVFELGTVAVLWYLRSHPDEVRLEVFANLLYLCAALGGSISLLVLPVVWRMRRMKPPLGLTVFSGAVAAAPVITLLFRGVR